MAVDWRAPWFEPWRDPGESIARRWGSGVLLHDALNADGGAPVRFVSQSELPAGRAYESHIHQSGDCPTRESLHDFFNGLVWLRFPHSKRRLNALQAQEIAGRGVGPARGPLRDALTLWDENGALLQAPPPLWDALLARDWRRLFVDLRPLWTQAGVLVFGHALLEKLVRPRKDLTAHVWTAPFTGASMAEIDPWLAGQLTPERLREKPFTPLPLLGVPGWSPENQNFSFYDDSLTFRPAGRYRAKPAT